MDQGKRSDALGVQHNLSIILYKNKKIPQPSPTSLDCFHGYYATVSITNCILKWLSPFLPVLTAENDCPICRAQVFVQWNKIDNGKDDEFSVSHDDHKANDC